MPIWISSHYCRRILPATLVSHRKSGYYLFRTGPKYGSDRIPTYVYVHTEHVKFPVIVAVWSANWCGKDIRHCSLQKCKNYDFSKFCTIEIIQWVPYLNRRCVCCFGLVFIHRSLSLSFSKSQEVLDDSCMIWICTVISLEEFHSHLIFDFQVSSSLFLVSLRHKNSHPFGSFSNHHGIGDCFHLLSASSSSDDENCCFDSQYCWYPT